MNKIIKSFIESNRWKHFILVVIVSIPVIFLPTYLDVIYIACACAGCLEFKDKSHGGEWDWLDFLYSIILPVIIGIVLLIYNLL